MYSTMDRLHDLLERIGHLLRAQERQAGAEEGLQPVHLHALRYLDSCNRYSDHPAAVTEYLGLTKGTVSQTLSVLEQKGLVSRRDDTRDRRVVHLRPTAKGRRLLERAFPPELLRAAVSLLPDSGARLEGELESLLVSLQRAHGARSFGVCATCRFLRREQDRFTCGLTSEPLRVEETERICREHEAPVASAN